MNPRQDRETILCGLYIKNAAGENSNNRKNREAILILLNQRTGLVNLFHISLMVQSLRQENKKVLEMYFSVNLLCPKMCTQAVSSKVLLTALKKFTSFWIESEIPFNSQSTRSML